MPTTPTVTAFWRICAAEHRNGALPTVLPSFSEQEGHSSSTWRAMPTLGMVGHAEMRLPLDGLQKGTVVTDLVYNPLKTRLLEVAESKGCVTVDGLGMLLHQGVPGFERWFGPRPEVTEATRRAVLA